MRLNDALENEKNRQERESWNKIYLHKDGKFFHAYEWSAWLIKAFVCTEGFQKERGDSKMLSAFFTRQRRQNTLYLVFLLNRIASIFRNMLMQHRWKKTIFL